MPRINLIPLKKKEYTKVSESGSIVYNTTIWKKLRLEYLKENSLCEICKKNDKITLAIDVHHIQPISSVKSIEEKKLIGFDWNNLEALCKQCHIDIHKIK